MRIILHYNINYYIYTSPPLIRAWGISRLGILKTFLQLLTDLNQTWPKQSGRSNRISTRKRLSSAVDQRRNR